METVLGIVVLIVFLLLVIKVCISTKGSENSSVIKLISDTLLNGNIKKDMQKEKEDSQKEKEVMNTNKESNIGLTSIDYKLLVYHEFGVLNNFNKLAEVMREIENGNVELMESLAVLYEYGHEELGIPRDIMKRNYWFFRAAQCGSATASYYYGNYLVSASHEGKIQDVALKGMDYLIKSANAGYPRAQYMVGIAYNNGFIVEKSKTKACEYLQLAANNGENEALEILSEIHL